MYHINRPQEPEVSHGLSQPKYAIEDVLKEYNCEILYHPGKANVVADALSCRAKSAPIRDVCMRMKVMTLVLDTIQEA